MKPSTIKSKQFLIKKHNRSVHAIKKLGQAMVFWTSERSAMNYLFRLYAEEMTGRQPKRSRLPLIPKP